MERNTEAQMNEDYDVVVDVLTKHKNKLWAITQSNMNADMMNLMDDIRLQQIQELNEAIGMWLIWKDEKKLTAEERYNQSIRNAADALAKEIDREVIEMSRNDQNTTRVD